MSYITLIEQLHKNYIGVRGGNMEPNGKSLSASIDKTAEKWDISGSYTVIKDGEILHDGIYGFADREKGIKNTENSTYAFSAASPLLLGLCLMKLQEMGRLNINHKLSKYIPEYKWAERITLKNLALRDSGIPDFYYSRVMVQLKEEEKGKELSDYDRVRLETAAFHNNRSFKKVMELVGEDDLEFEPGNQDESSESEEVFMAEVIERVSGMSLFQFEKRHIFDPLGMNETVEGYSPNTAAYMVFRNNQLVRLPEGFKAEGAFTTTHRDLVSFMKGFCDNRLLSDKSWSQLQNNGRGTKELFISSTNGISYGLLNLSAYEFGIYFDRSKKLIYGNLCNERLKVECVDGVWTYFRREARQELESFFTYPEHTKMVRLNRKNLWDALGIAVNPGQEEYVLEAKSSIAMGLVFKECKVFVEMEGNRAIGLLVLQVNKKKGIYEISIVQIDKHYQGRGYGRIMLQWAVDYLKAQGAKELTIGVNRFNIAAQRLYMSVGFKIKAAYEEGMTLNMIL